MITTSCIGVIYIWKLPESVTKLLKKYKLPAINPKNTALNLDQIDEDENEDSIRRFKKPLNEDSLKMIASPEKIN